MGNTAIDEQRGGSVDVTLGSPTVYQAGLPSGPGGVRLYVVRPTVAGSSFRLPNPNYCTVGAEPVCVVINKGTQSIDITNFGGTLITSLAANRAIEAYLLIVGVDLWSPIGPFVVSSSGGLNGNRKPFEVVYTASSTTRTNVRTDVAKQYGYVGADGPAAVAVTIKSGVVLGGGTPTGASFGTGGWPAGSTMLITLESGAFIAGAGGAGGRGADINGAGVGAGGDGGLAMNVLVNAALINNGTIQGGGGGGGGAARRLINSVWLPGGSGGLAMDVRVNAALINNGTIQGGGGGGGGAARRLINSVFLPGGSGGGGAGANPGAGGGIVNSNNATIGQAGSFTAGGLAGDAGGYQGGVGGAPGALGGNGAPGTAGGGGARGAAGTAIQVLASGGFSLTKIVAGTITGAETSI